MMAVLMDGKKVAEKILKPVKKEILNLKKKGVTPYLAIILVGREDPQSLVYIREKRKKAKEIGIKTMLFRFKKETRVFEIKNLIKQLNQDLKIHGILVQLPLPAYLNTDEILETILPAKEVDGLTLNSSYKPACASGIMELLSFYKIPVKNKKVVILGAGKTVGQPLFKLMQKEKINVTLCDSRTKNLKTLSKRADILVGALLVKNFIDKSMVKKGAVVIDAAKNARREVKTIASYLTPKIGGVGPMTIAMLLKNLIRAAKTLTS